MDTTIIGTKKGEIFCGIYDKGERLKMSRKVLKNWGRPFSHIFQFGPASLFSHEASLRNVLGVDHKNFENLRGAVKIRLF